MELPHGAHVEHPALNGSTLRACPTCISQNPDWENRVLSVLGLAGGFGPHAVTP